MIQMTNYQFYQYLVNYNINQESITGIYCINNKLTEQLLLDISGINNAKGIYYRSKKVFDNKEYFDNRLYLNCNKQIFNTLLSKRISEELLKYNIILNENEFNIISKELRIRSEGKLDDSYTFTKEGIALSNNALAISTYKYPILLNPFENIDSIYKLQYLKDKYKRKSLLVGITNIKKYENFLDHLILFGFRKIHILNPNEQLIVFENIINQDMVIEEANLNDYIIHKNIQNESIIIKSDINSSQLKALNNLKVKKKAISIYDLGEYLC